MTQLAICTDLDRCVGCLACSVSCKVVNGVPIGNFWNKTLRVGPTPKEGGSGQFPDVETYFLNVQRVGVSHRGVAQVARRHHSD